MKIAAIWFSWIVSLAFVQACSESNDEPAPVASADAEHSEIVKRDLFSIITLQGSPCRRVVSYDVQNKLDYVATCETGDRYRVHVSSEGKVHVNEHVVTE